MDLANWLGFSGTLLMLLAYFLHSNDKIKSEGFLYIMMNLIGSLLAAISAQLIHFVPFLILECAWCISSFVNLIKWIIGKFKKH